MACHWASLKAQTIGFCFLWRGSSGVSSGTSSSSWPGLGMPWLEKQCHHLMLDWGTGVSDMLKARGAGMDPVSITACSWAAAGIPKRAAKEMLLVRSCGGYTSAQHSSDGQAQRATENFFAKGWCLAPPLPSLCGSVQKHCPGEPVAGQQPWLHGVSWLWWAGCHYDVQPILPLSPAPCSGHAWML